MAVIQTPDNYSFAGNLKDIIATTNNSTKFVLFQDGVEILRETYNPQSGRITINLRHFFETQLSAASLDSIEVASSTFPSFTYSLSNSLEWSVVENPFHVLPGGVAGHTDTEMFCKSNFLTMELSNPSRRSLENRIIGLSRYHRKRA